MKFWITIAATLFVANSAYALATRDHSAVMAFMHLWNVIVWPALVVAAWKQLP